MAVVVPDEKELMGGAKENGVEGDYEAAVKNPKVRHLEYISGLCPFSMQVSAALLRSHIHYPPPALHVSLLVIGSSAGMVRMMHV